MRSITVLIRESKLNGPTECRISYGDCRLIDIPMSDADLDEIQDKVWEVVNRNL